MNWLETQEADRLGLKESIWGDEDFLAWIEKKGKDEALRDVMEFRWALTDQVSARRLDGSITPEWEVRITRLIIKLNQRKSQLQRYIRATEGDDYFYELRAEIEEDNRD